MSVSDIVLKWTQVISTTIWGIKLPSISQGNLIYTPVKCNLFFPQIFLRIGTSLICSAVPSPSMVIKQTICSVNTTFHNRAITRPRQKIHRTTRVDISHISTETERPKFCRLCFETIILEGNYCFFIQTSLKFLSKVKDTIDNKSAQVQLMAGPRTSGGEALSELMLVKFLLAQTWVKQRQAENVLLSFCH